MWAVVRNWINRNDQSMRFVAWLVSTVFIAVSTVYGIYQSLIIPSIETQFDDLTYSRTLTKPISANGTQVFRLQCDSQDIALSYSYTTENNRFEESSPLLKGVLPLTIGDRVNGFELTIYNGADRKRPTSNISTYISCFRS